MPFHTCRIAVWLAAFATVAASCSSSAPSGSVATTATLAGSESTSDRWGCGTNELSCTELVELGLTYPYPRLPDSYLFVDGVAFPYVEMTDDPLGDSVVKRPDGSQSTAAELLDTLEVPAASRTLGQPVIAYGSNPSAEQLTRKFAANPAFRGRAVIPTVRGSLRDYDVVFAPHLMGYGAMPATIVPSPGTDVEVWINWMDQAEIDRMNSSEGSGGLYAFGRLGDIDLNVPGPSVDGPLAYIDCFGALEIDGTIFPLSAVDATGRTSEPIDEPEALSRVIAALGWQASAFDLVATVIRSEEERTARTEAMSRLARQISHPQFSPQVPCSLEPESRAGGEF